MEEKMAVRNVNKSKKRNITQQNLAATPINPSGGPLTKNTRKRPFLLEVLFNALKLLLFALIVMGFGVLGLVYGVGKAYVDSTPLLEVSQLTRSDRTSYLYDMYGNEITNLTSMEYRDWADFNEIPDILKNAFVSIEDVRFYKHQGVDFKRVFSAALEILGNSNSSGGSTITQQLIKNKVLGSQRTYKRKMQEAYLAIQLEKVVDKDQILEAYLNDIYLGGSNYGVKAAAKDYFGKDLSELTIRECALLAGLTQSPYYYNPRQNMYYRDGNPYYRTVNRTNTVLERMYQNGYITKEQYISALEEQDNILPVSKNAKMYEMAYFVEYAMNDVISHWMAQDGAPDTAANRTYYENMLRTGGYKIYTTVDPKIQNTVQETLSTWNGYPELADSSAATLTEEISETVTIQTVEPQAAAVVIDQTNGFLRAIVGGRDEPLIRKGLNRAAQSYTQVGSCIKPLAVYGPALDKGMSPASVVINAEGTIAGWGTEKGYPGGGLTSSRTYGFVTLRSGLAQSLNVVAARVLMENVGVATAAEYMQRLGIPASQLNLDGPGLALGTSGITPIQMCAAYAAIANNGYYWQPISFTRVEDEDGRVILDADVIRSGATKVYQQTSTAYQLVDILTDAVNNGTGKLARLDGFRVAGKTGTNSKYSSVYFAGMTCEYTAVVWIGHDLPSNKLKTGSTGGDYAAALWQAFMAKVMEGREDRPIINENPTMLGMVQRTVCPVSGRLASPGCIKYQATGKKFTLVTDWFDYDSVPTDYCDMHVTVSICRDSGCRAGAYCDPKSVEDVTYVLIRPDSMFFDLSDEVLSKIFGKTYVRTDKTPEAFINSLPVCNLAESLSAAKASRDELIRQVTEYLSGASDIDSGDRSELANLIGIAAAANTIADVEEATAALQAAFDRIRSMEN
jgi:penicillin-binding protein 1A